MNVECAMGLAQSINVGAIQFQRETAIALEPNWTHCLNAVAIVWLTRMKMGSVMTRTPVLANTMRVASATGLDRFTNADVRTSLNEIVIVTETSSWSTV